MSNVLTRIKNNQITDSTILANTKIVPGSIVGSLFNSNLTMTSDVTITGNLTVQGSSTYLTVASTNTYVNDPLIVLNNSFSGTNTYDIGLIFNRGGLTTTALVWNESQDEFQFGYTSDDGTTYGAIANSGFANVKLGNLNVQYIASVGSLTATGDLGAVNLTLSGDAAVNGGDLTTTAGTFNLIDVTATTVNFAGAATAIDLGATTGTLTINNPTVVGTQASQDLYNTTATTLNFAGAATTLIVGATTGVANIRNATTNILGNATIGGTITLPNGAVIKDNANDAIAFGQNAGSGSQDTRAVAIGNYAGSNSQGFESIAVGSGAGESSGFQATAIGPQAGQTSQGDYSVAVGHLAGASSQGDFSVAIGDWAGGVNQSGNAVAIGNFAGYSSQGDNSLALGKGAGAVSQAANTIILNATGANVNGVSAQTDSFYVAPIRNATGNVGTLQYNSTTKEVTYSLDLTLANITLTGDLAVNGGDITTTASTFNLLNANATTVDAFKAATDLEFGATTGTLTINNPTVVGSQATQDVFNTTATTVNAFGAATTLIVGATTGVANIRNATTNIIGNATVGGTLDVTDEATLTANLAVNGGDLTTSATTFNLLDSNATTVNAFGAATTISIGAATGNTTINNNLDVELTLSARDINSTVIGNVTPATGKFTNIYNTALTETRIPFVGAANVLTDSTNLTYTGGNLTVQTLVFNGATAEISVIGGTGNVTLKPDAGGVIDASSSVIANVTDPSNAQDAVTLSYLQTQLNSGVTNIQNDNSDITITDDGTNPGVITANVDATTVVAFDASAASFYSGFVTVDYSTSNVSVDGTLWASGNVTVEGTNIFTSQSTFNLVDTNATTVNFAGAATALDIGATSGTATINNATLSLPNVTNIAVSQTTVTFANTVATSVDAFGAATTLTLASATGDTIIRNNLTAGGNINIDSTAQSTNTSSGALIVDGGVGVAKNLNVGGDVIITGNLQVDGLVTSVNTATLDVEDLNITVAKGAGSSAAANGAGLTVDGANATLLYTHATTSWNLNKHLIGTSVEFSGNATLLANLAVTGATTLTGNVGITGDTTLTGDLAVNGGDLTTTASTFNLITANATTVHFANAATTLNIGAGTGTLTLNNATVTTPGQIVTTRAGSATTGNGQIFLNGATSNRIDWATAGTGAPTFTTRTDGTKVVLYPALSGSTVDYAIGIDSATMWSSVPENTGSFNFKWYGAETLVANLSGTGNFTTVGDVAVNGGDLTTTAATFNLVNTDATTVNLAGAATTLIVGATTGAANIRNATTNIIGNATVGGDTTLTGDIAVNGGDLTTTAGTFNLLDATATTVNAFGAATTIDLGATTGTLTINNPTVVGSQTTQDLYNTTATTVNFAGAATTLIVGATTGIANIRNATTNIIGNATVGGKLDVVGLTNITDNLAVTGNITANTRIYALSTSGSNAAPSYSFSNHAGSGMYHDTNYLRFALNGTDSFILNLTGPSSLLSHQFADGDSTTLSITSGTWAQTHGLYFAASGVVGVKGIVDVINTAVSTTTTTGAMKIAGGLGVVGNVVAGALYGEGYLTTLTATGTTTLGLTSATAINSTPIGNVTPSTGAFTDLTSTGTTQLGITNATAINSTPIGNATPSTGAFTTISATSAVTANATISANGIIYANSTIASTSYTTGAVVVAGGIGANGNISVPLGKQITVGIEDPLANVSYPERQIIALANINASAGMNLRNLSSGNIASTNYIAVADNNTGESNYFTFGVAGSGFNIAGSMIKANDGYIQGAGGNLILSAGAGAVLIGSSSSATDLLATFGGDNANVSINATQISLTPTTGAFNVAGGAGFGSNIFVANGAVINYNQTADNFLVKGVNTNSLLAINSNYGAIVMGGSNATPTLGSVVKFNSTDSIQIPVGSTADRPSNTGNVDLKGMIRFNSSTNNLEYYAGSSWAVAGSDTTFTIITSEQFTGNGSANVYTLSANTTTNGTVVSINGILQIPTLAYSINGTTLAFTENPASGDLIDVRILTTTKTAGSEVASSNGFVSFNATDAKAEINAGAGGKIARVELTPDGVWNWKNGTKQTYEQVETTTSTTITVIDSYPALTYSSAKYIVQVKNGSDIESMEALLVSTGADAYITTYGVISSNVAMGTLSANVVSGNVRLYYNTALTSSNVKVYTTYIV